MNFADSDEMVREFAQRGFSRSENEQAADAVLVNTCTVRDHAEHKAMSYIGSLKPWKDDHPDRLLIVTGCAAERVKDNLKKRFPFLDLVVGAKDIESFPEELDQILNSRPLQEENLIPLPLAASLGSASPVVQFVTIMRGCNYSCSYCIVPQVRGREKYRAIPDIVKDVEIRLLEGAKEIWLLGQTVNSYQPPDPPFADYDFADLLRDVNAIAGVKRIRFMSPHPHYLTPKLITALAECENVCEQIHLPVQSGSTAVLKRMKRTYTRQSYLQGISELKKRIPKIALTTDVIVGFPGETEGDFAETLTLMEEVGFDNAYCFKYSPRPGTLSGSWEDDILTEVKEERLGRLLNVVESFGQIKAKAFIGSEQEVLIEEELSPGVFRGKTRGAWKVRFHEANLTPGDIITAHITGTHSRELHGEGVKSQLETFQSGNKKFQVET